MITLANILSSSQQEIFNKCSEHLLKQNKKSIDESVGCLYKDDNGLTCAIGCFITEEEYDPNMEQEGIDGQTFISFFKKQYNFLSEDINEGRLDNMSLLMALQYVHDNHDVEDWEISLKEVAKEFSLKIKK
tara:strand:+ start:77 stop:469 length:393 start_codon:yes stop_codon:yes gene_type:complete